MVSASPVSSAKKIVKSDMQRWDEQVHITLDCRIIQNQMGAITAPDSTGCLASTVVVQKDSS